MILFGGTVARREKPPFQPENVGLTGLTGLTDARDGQNASEAQVETHPLPEPVSPRHSARARGC